MCHVKTSLLGIIILSFQTYTIAFSIHCPSSKTQLPRKLPLNNRRTRYFSPTPLRKSLPEEQN